jgi:hypothetical protein
VCESYTERATMSFLMPAVSPSRVSSNMGKTSRIMRIVILP